MQYKNTRQISFLLNNDSNGAMQPKCRNASTFEFFTWILILRSPFSLLVNAKPLRKAQTLQEPYTTKAYPNNAQPRHFFYYGVRLSGDSPPRLLGVLCQVQPNRGRRCGCGTEER
ncbi:hypothetical protein M378DRAFT_391544 [Amanita muscaria Koide BX008]|uniref:Uncharacterized protein n=1 Tax=Amanita muscaria (strain Koide BX008) TaxID=946122 RepID=A0A0C2ST12_AMAMK|nr:hypothetical protein M378DRAFT_391544 [Amanita muscaria Koide BX008]